MAKGKRQRVLILFLGGSTIDPRGRVGDTVQKEKDVEPWMEQMSEMNLIAETEGVFVASGMGTMGIPEWRQAGEIIQKNYQRVDGFVIVHQFETMRAAGVALTLMLQGLGKPVVIVGSPMVTVKERDSSLLVRGKLDIPDAGAKASFINAVQVAISDVGEVVLIMGNTIFRGNTVARVHDSLIKKYAGTVLGKIDFGIRLFGDQLKRADRGLRAKTNFETRVAVVEYLPGHDIRFSIGMAKGAIGVFLASVEPGMISLPVLRQLAAGIGLKKPLLINAPLTDTKNLPPNVITTWGPTRTGALLRFMWALGQGRSIQDVRRLVKLYEPKRKE